jgi:hypothetical protein
VIRDVAAYDISAGDLSPVAGFRVPLAPAAAFVDPPGVVD